MAHAVRKTALILILSATAGLVIGLLLLRLMPGRETADASGGDAPAAAVHEGGAWRRNPNITTILVMGVDDWDSEDGTGYRADAIMLLVMDRETQTLQPVMISRDTMTTVDVYNDEGTYTYSGTMHLNMQFRFGRNAEESCGYMQRTVSRLLQGTAVDRYCSVTLAGIGQLVDTIGGVTLVLPEDWTDMDPTWTAGAVVPLNGEQAVYLLQQRDTEAFGSNNDRMNRQAWFLKEVFRQVAGLPRLQLLTIYNEVRHDLTTDLDLTELYELAQCSLVDEVLYLPGADVEGERHDEFYVDDRALKAFIIETFYERVA